MATQPNTNYCPKDFVKLSHLANKQHYSTHSKEGVTREGLESAIDPNNFSGYHLCQQMRIFDPLFETFRGSSWLTLGDGRAGREAFYIQQKQCKVLPTDLDDSLLQLAKEQGIFEEVRSENAEQLSFEDDSFDFIFCKETLHHVPRPYAALYEMLRTCKKGFGFVEPADRRHPFSMIWHATLEREKVLNDLKGSSEYLAEPYEEVGNYAYTFTIRDIEKFALGAGLRWIAYQGVHVQDTREQSSKRKKSDSEEDLIREYNYNQRHLEYVSEKGLAPWGSYAFLVFTLDNLPDELIEQLKSNGWQVKCLPENPYLLENLKRAQREKDCNNSH